ncbi:MAG: type II toxin-antitoxin system RelE/ParE family toxin [Candidatus Paceibacterota bacterium]|jgi:mRNA interferase RelE/StbE
MSRYSIQFTKRAEDDATRLDSTVFVRVKGSIETKLIVDPFRFGKSLTYSLCHLRTLRVGDWRVIYKISETVVTIFTIRHRKQGYGDLS